MSVTSWPVAASPSLFRQCGGALGDRVLRLQEEPLAILKALYRLGNLVVTTFSAGSRVSQNMHYPVLHDGEWWLEAVGQRCRLRQSLQVDHWHSVLAVLEPVGDLPARSLLFFDRHGDALQQMAVAPGSGGLAFEELVCAMLHPDQQRLCFPGDVDRRQGRGLDSLTELERDWTRSDDEDSFSRLLMRYGNRRAHLYRAVRDSFACPLRPETLPAVLASAADSDTATTLCVGNRGVRLCMSAPWSAPRWQGNHCHLAHNGALVSLDMARVGSLWRLRKPGDGQVLTALEALDEKGEWLWTLSAGDEDEARWRTLLGNSVIRQC
ncbi:hypothetical protein A11A3_03914 [Alcanivorax hongdengensis A-11-3]|uniref:Haemin-degrading HemS/ChuX domain-containing protein n=1 Tax=Alcanivorax hongdengensis A-11-3 TaxID=1177179 RepID=L0WF64_9GAMM|nr:ChuX/HutX family heme-like substrate-binding protein [Alcanivorax hongdengensis]EKF75473.1 hypothetical protein A11A3_03914 [Alcanivorax hongdengensis A-11-3]